MENITKGERMNKKGETGIKSLLVSILLVGLFAYAIISVGVNMAEDNNANFSIADNPIINASFRRVDTNLSSAEDSSSDLRESLEKGVPEEDKFNPIVAIWGVIIGFGSMAAGLYNIIFGLAANILGVPKIVLGVFTTILTIVIAAYIWRAWKAGS